MALVYIPKVYLLAADSQLTASVRLSGLFKFNPFEKIPAITRYLVVPNIDCIFLKARGPTQQLAAALRQQFRDRVFVLAPISEAVWEFINATRSTFE